MRAAPDGQTIGVVSNNHVVNPSVYRNMPFDAVNDVKRGALRAIGVMGNQRVASLPDLPTIAEQGFPNVDIAGWFAVIGPAKMPAAQVRRLHEALVAAFATPETKEAMAKQENVIQPTTPEAAAQFFRTEHDRYARLAKKADIKVD